MHSTLLFTSVLCQKFLLFKGKALELNGLIKPLDQKSMEFYIVTIAPLKTTGGSKSNLITCILG
jgi:hypothetical protein